MFQNIRTVFLLIVYLPILIWVAWQESLDEEIKDMYESRGIYLGN